MHISAKEALSQFKESDQLFSTLFKHGSLRIEIYKPVSVDLQQPHEQDEVYVIISGNGKFINGSSTCIFVPGDFLFVPAGTEHRFVDFSEDFSTWVIFYGPKGGEKNSM